MVRQPDPIIAAHNILTRSFGLRKDQSLLLFVDEDSLDIVDVLLAAARRQGLSISTFFVSHAAQLQMQHAESLPLPVEAAIRESDAILSCLSPRAEHLAYRLKVLRAGWNRRTKLAHAPGLNLAILSAADTDYGYIAESGLLLARALVLGRQVEVITYDQAGQEYRLAVEIGGWDYPPGISDGVIPDGAWANVPPGEAYVVPQNANGHIVINGSIPGLVMRPGEELILTFRSGRLVDFQPADSPAARHLYATQISYAQSRDDPNWSNLAELGFGLNPSVHQLIGVELLDEKKAHTVHVALGHSASLGGKVDSVIHCDMIAERPTVRIDGRLVLKRGEWRAKDSDWRPDAERAAVPPDWWQKIERVRRSGMRAEIDRDRLVCRWTAGRGRWDAISVGAEPTARLAAHVYSVLPESGEPLTRQELTTRLARWQINQRELPGLLWVMQQYDVVRLEPEPTP